MKIKEICSPALLYLIISVISLLAAAANKLTLASLIVQAIFIIAWTWFLNWLCTSGHKDVAWFLVILPFIFILGMFVIAMEIVSKNR
jgi:hypothetical protein